MVIKKTGIAVVSRFITRFNFLANRNFCVSKSATFHILAVGSNAGS